MQRVIDLLDLDPTCVDKDKLPPIHLWDPQKTIDSEMHIDAEGRWFHQGDEILRLALCRLFASILRKEEEQYYLITPAEKFLIQVADVPFIASTVLEKELEGQSSLIFANTLGEHLVLDQHHPIELRHYQGVQVPYIKVRDDLFARVSRSCFYHLIDYAHARSDDGNEALYVQSQGQHFLLGSLTQES